MLLHSRSCDAKLSRLKVGKTTLTVAVAALLFTGAAQSLEIGFEGFLSYEMRQNTDEGSTDGVNNFDEPLPDTDFGNGLIGVFGEQRSRLFSAGFSGELETQKNLTDDDAPYNTDSRFIGAGEFAITPRTLRWYFGDILTGIRNDDAVRLADDINEDTINVLVTGPSYQSEVEGVSSTSARLFYVHQSEDDEEVQSLYNFSVSHQRDTNAGSFYGVRFNDIYTAVVENPDEDPALVDLEDDDFNRMELSLFSSRIREFSEIYAEIGATRYTTENDTTEGLTAALNTTRTLGPRTTLSAGIEHSLNDQALNTIEALFVGGGDDAGLQPEIDGIFAETRINVNYVYEKRNSALEFGLSVAKLDYRLLTGNAAESIDIDGEDQYQGVVNASFAKNYTNRLRGVFSLAYEQEEFINRTDHSEAMLVGADLIYTLTRSLDLEFSLTYDTGEGVTTQGTVDDFIENIVDETETNATIGIRWVPPTRASRELTVEINSLLE